MKIKQLTLILLTCILSYTSIAQTLLDPLGNPTTEVFPETNTSTITLPASSSLNVINVIPSPTNSPIELAFDGEYLWVTGFGDYVLFQVSPSDGSIIKTIPIPDVEYPAGLTFDGENLWLGNNQDEMVFEIDTLDGTILNSFLSPADPNESFPTGLGWDGTSIWHNDAKTPTAGSMNDVIYNFSTDGSLIEEMDHLFNFPSGLTFEGDYLWCSDNVTDRLYKIDMNTFTVVDDIDAPGGDFPNGLAFDGQFLWVANNDSDSLYQIAITTSFNIEYNLQEPLCNGDANGAISVSYIPTDTLLFFNWSNGATGSSIVDLEAGDYGLTITNTDGIIVLDTLLTITDPDPLLLQANQIIHPTCPGASDGSISTLLLGGVPNYSYLWNTGDTSPEIFGLTIGVYSVTVTDANLCTQESTFSIFIAAIDGVTFTTPETANGMDGSAGFSDVTGGTAPYTYVWNTVPVQTTMVATGLEAGFYNVTITDANNCNSIVSFEVTTMTSVMDDLGISSFEIYPNPASEVAYIELAFVDNKDWDLSVYQINGRLVKALKPQNGKTKNERIVLDDLPSGEYIVTLKIQGENISRTLIVK